MFKIDIMTGEVMLLLADEESDGADDNVVYEVADFLLLLITWLMVRYDVLRLMLVLLLSSVSGAMVRCVFFEIFC